MPSEVERVVETNVDDTDLTEIPKDDTKKEAEFTQKVVPMARPPPPFPKRLVKKTEEGKCRWFIVMLKQLSINVSFIEALKQMPGYEKEDPGAFTIHCTIRILRFAKAWCDLGANINLMPLSIYKKLGLGAPKPTAMCLLMVDRIVRRPIGVLQDVLVKVESLFIPTDFVILDCEVDFEVPIILGRPFVTTGRSLVDMERGQMKFHLNNEELSFNICWSMKYESYPKSVSVMNHTVVQGL
ncbi:uncharacterized protein LOC125825106 [Solanum verrucosum]|uniref:uncharacterized protein LOC125825106 n=1 Tax=Solanum verrucosum TaxID=315347 RepID=UPI0020D1ACB1|nr:uncharacterized protein LOC125825106 [Solanum verrucosum]